MRTRRTQGWPVGQKGIFISPQLQQVLQRTIRIRPSPELMAAMLFPARDNNLNRSPSPREPKPMIQDIDDTLLRFRPKPIGNLLLLGTIMHDALGGVSTRQVRARLPRDVRQRSHVVTAASGALLCGVLRAGDTMAEHVVALGDAHLVPPYLSRTAAAHQPATEFQVS